MRFGGRWSSSPRATIYTLSVLVILAFGSAGCSKPSASPLHPDAPEPLLGTWVGTITSEVIGPGTVTLVINAQVGPDQSPLLSGTWRFAFPQATFSTTGPVVANLNSAKTILGLTFDRSTVPCPAEAGGAALRTMLASMIVSGRRMQGSYVAAGCPGGTLDLILQ